MSLYAENKEAWDAIAVYRPSVAEMSKQFKEASAMETALGFGPSVICKWVRKRGGVSLDADRRAAVWLDRQRNGQPVAAPASAAGVLMLVSCPDPATAAKAARLLGVIGCEATEV